MIHGTTVLVGAGVHVHVVGQQVEALGSGDDLNRRHERKVGDRAVAGDEENHVAAGGHLARDALQIVTRAVHEIEPGFHHRLAVLDGAIESNGGVSLSCRADRFEYDVVETTKLVAARRVALSGYPVTAGALLKALDHGQEPLCRREVAHIGQDVRFGADELVGLGQVGSAAVTDELTRHPSRQRITGDAGERVGTPALEGELHPAQRYGRAAFLLHVRQPLSDLILGLPPPDLERGIYRHVGMRELLNRIVVLPHVLLQVPVRHLLGAVVDGQHRTDVWMNTESGKRSQQQLSVVGRGVSTALSMGESNDAVDVDALARRLSL